MAFKRVPNHGHAPICLIMTARADASTIADLCAIDTVLDWARRREPRGRTEAIAEPRNGRSCALSKRRRRGRDPNKDGALAWMERVTRIELAFSAWEADVLPLNYTRVGGEIVPVRRRPPKPGAG